MSDPRRTNQSDPTAERTADPGEDVFNRNEEVRYDTPRRYEEDDPSAPLYPDDEKD